MHDPDDWDMDDETAEEDIRATERLYWDHIDQWQEERRKAKESTEPGTHLCPYCNQRMADWDRPSCRVCFEQDSGDAAAHAYGGEH